MILILKYKKYSICNLFHCLFVWTFDCLNCLQNFALSCADSKRATFSSIRTSVRLFVRPPVRMYFLVKIYRCLGMALSYFVYLSHPLLETGIKKLVAIKTLIPINFSGHRKVLIYFHVEILLEFFINKHRQRL